MPGGEDEAGNDDKRGNGERKIFRIIPDAAPILSQIESHPDQNQVPDAGAQDSVDGEFFQIHLADAGGDRYQMPHDRYETRDENGDLAFLAEPVFRPIKVGFVQEAVFAELADESFPAVAAHPIGYQRADQRTDHRGDPDKPEIELAGGGKIAGKRQNQFGRQWHDHAFQSHQKNHAGIAERLGDADGQSADQG